MTRIADDDQDPSTALVFLWDVEPGDGERDDAESWCGVAGRKQQAMDAAEKHLGESGTATVEKARLMLDGMRDVHWRTGVGWEGTSAGGRVSWSPLKRQHEAFAGRPGR